VTPTDDLRDAELRRLTRDILAPGAREPFGAYLFRRDDAGAELGRYVERMVFLEAFGNTAETLEREYGPYDEASVFICVVDQMRRLPAGMMRVLLPSPTGFKSLNDIEPVWGVPVETLMDRTGIAVDPEKTWDIATLAVASDYRSKAARGLVSMGLYQTLTLAARHNDVEWFVAILDMPVFRLLRWKLRMIFAGYKSIAPLPYLGSAASIPAWCDVVAAEKRLATTDRDLHAVLVQGIGLEHALRPVDLRQIERLVPEQPEEATG